MEKFLMTMIIGLVVLVLLVSVLSFVFLLIAAHILFTIHLKRDSKEKWARRCSSDLPVQQQMFSSGLVWSRCVASRCQAVKIYRDGLALCGEYYDFGFEKAVILIPGRTESLYYSYYYAEPYEACGYNVLLIDQRAHGNSDGTYNTTGFEESGDVLAWAEMLTQRFGVTSVLLHGISIGAACGLFALTSENCPSYMEGLVADGMYETFFDVFKNHMIEMKKPVFPLIHLVNFWCWIYTDHTISRGPIDYIDRMTKPLLLLHSREDLYSLPEKAEDLFRRCPSQKKQLVFFEHGRHSMLRIADPIRYDGAIRDFIQRIHSNNDDSFSKEV